MNFVSLLKDTLHILRSDDYKVVSPEELQKRREESARNICANLSSGSIFLAQGKYVTTQQFEEAKEKFLAT